MVVFSRDFPPGVMVVGMGVLRVVLWMNMVNFNRLTHLPVSAFISGVLSGVCNDVNFLPSWTALFGLDIVLRRVVWAELYLCLLFF